MSSYTRFACVVYSGEVKGEVGTRSGMCCVGWLVLVLSVVVKSIAISYDYMYIYISVYKLYTVYTVRYYK